MGYQYTSSDELFTINMSTSSLSFTDVFIKALTFDYTPPIYYLCAHISILLFGATTTAIRYPSAIFGIILIPVIYLIGKEYKDELLGLIMSGFATVYYNGVYYAKYGRSYSMAIVFCSMAFYFFMRLIRGDRSAWLGFAAFSILSMWTHIYTSIPIGLMVLILLLNNRIHIKTIGVITIGCLPLLNYIQLIINTRLVTATGTNTFTATPLEIFFGTPLDIFTYSCVLILPIIIYGLWKYRNDIIIRYISIITISVWVSMFIISYITPVVLHYAIFCVPMLMIPLCLPIYNAIETKQSWYSWFLVCLVIIVLEVVQVVALNTLQRV